MKNTVKCNKFPDTHIPAVLDDEGKELEPERYEESCRFYVLETRFSKKKGRDENTGKRWKVQVDGPVDFKAVAKAFQSQGVEVSEAELKKAHE